MADQDSIKLGAIIEPDVNDFQRRMSALEKQLKPISVKIQTVGGFGTKEISDFTSYLDRANQRVISFTSSVGVLYSAIKVFKDIVSSTIEVNKALGDINSTMKLSSGGLTDFSSKLFDTAKATSSSFESAAAAAQLFARQGLSAQEVIKRTTDALTLARIANIDAKEAVEELTTATSVFNKSGVSTKDIVDKISVATSRFAVSSKDITDAMSRFGATAQSAGVSLDQFIALITTAEQSTQRGGAAISGALNAIFTRLEPQKALDALQKLGIAVTDSGNHALSTFAVFQNLAKAYGTLGDASKAQVDKLVGGGRQLDIFKATLSVLSQENNTFTQAQNALANASGSASLRLAAQNKELSALIQNFQTAAKAIGSNIGTSVVGAATPLVRNVSGASSGITDALAHANDSVRTTGRDLARDFLAGFGDSLTFGLGPLITVALFNVAKRTLSFVKNDLLSQTGLNSQSKELEGVQSQINRLYQIGGKELQAQLATLKSMTEVAAVFEKLIAEASATSAASAASQTFVAETILSRRKGGAAGGYLPIGDEAGAIAAHVGGAPSSAQPVVLRDFAFGGGQHGTIVANSSEWEVPNFANGGSAIFNRDMISRLGLPAGARPIAAQGYVPNAAEGGTFQYGSLTNNLTHIDPEFSARQVPTAAIDSLNELFKTLKDAPDLGSLNKAGDEIITFTKSLDKASKRVVEDQLGTTFTGRQATLKSPIYGLGTNYPGQGEVPIPNEGPGVRDPRQFSFNDRSRSLSDLRADVPEKGSVLYGGQYGIYNTPLPKGPSVAAAAAEEAAEIGFFESIKKHFSNPNVALGAAIALPFIGGAAQSAIGGENGTRRAEVGGFIGGSLSGAGAGIGIGSLFGPGGTIIGGIAAGLVGGITAALTKSKKSFEDVAAAIDQVNSKNEQLARSSEDYRTGLTNLQNAIDHGASPRDVDRLRGQNQITLNSLPGDLKAQYIAAGNDPAKLDRIQADFQVKQQTAIDQGEAVKRVGGLGTGENNADTAGNALAAALRGKQLDVKGIDAAIVKSLSISDANSKIDDTVIGPEGQVYRNGGVKGDANAPLIAQIKLLLQQAGVNDKKVQSTLTGLSGASQDDLLNALNETRRDFGLNAQGAKQAAGIKPSQYNAEDIRASLLNQSDTLRDEFQQNSGRPRFLREQAAQDLQFRRASDESTLQFDSRFSENQLGAATRILGSGRVRVGGRLQSGQDLLGGFQIDQATSEGNLRVSQAREDAGIGRTNAQAEQQDAINAASTHAVGDFAALLRNITPEKNDDQDKLKQISTIKDSLDKSDGSYESLFKVADSINKLDDSQKKALDGVLGKLNEQLAAAKYSTEKADQQGKDSIKLAEQKANEQLALAKQQVELQKIEAQASQRAGLLSGSGTFNLGALNRFAQAGSASRVPDGTRFGNLARNNAGLEQIGILDSLGLPRGQGTQDIEDKLRTQSTLGTLATLNARQLGKPVGADINSLQTSSQALIDSGTTSNVLLGRRTQESLKALQFDSKGAVTQLLNGKPTSEALQGLQEAGKVSVGDTGIISGISTSNTYLKTMADALTGATTPGGKPVLSTATTPQGVPLSLSAAPPSSLSPIPNAFNVAAPFSVATGGRGAQGVYASPATVDATAGLKGDPSQSPLSALGGGFGIGLSSQKGDSFGDIGTSLANNLTSSFANFWNSFATGATKGRNAFKDFAAGVFGDASKLFGDNAIKDLVGLAGSFIDPGATKVGGGALGGVVGSYASGGKIPVNLMAGEVLIPPGVARSVGYDKLNAMNYADGGLITGGSGLRDDVRRNVAPGSFVLKQSAVSRLGPQNLQALTSGRVQGHAIGGRIKGYSQDGTNGSSGLVDLTNSDNNITLNQDGSVPGQYDTSTGGFNSTDDYSASNDVTGGSNEGQDASSLVNAGYSSALSFLTFLAEKLFATTYHTLDPAGVARNTASLTNEQQQQLSSQAPGYHAYLVSNGRGGYSILNEGDPGASANVQNFSGSTGGTLTPQGFDEGGSVGVPLAGGPSTGSSSNSGVGVQITVHNYAAQGGGTSSSTTTQSPYSSAKFADQLGKQIEAKVKEVLINESRPGGFFPLSNRSSIVGPTG